jgi:hypothetical protein
MHPKGSRFSKLIRSGPHFKPSAPAVPDLKVATIIPCPQIGALVLAFPKLCATQVPSQLIRSAKAQCSIHRPGATARDLQLWSPRITGIIAAEWHERDRVEIRGAENLYELLFLADRKKPGIIAWIDCDLHLMLENQHRIALQ